MEFTDGAPLHMLEGDVWLPFWPPYRCVGCGIEISETQFRFSACCADCDCGLFPPHDPLPWDTVPFDRAETYRLFSEAHRPI